MNSDKIIDYMNENLKGYTFGQLRHAALSRLSYPGADLSAEDCPDIRMPEAVALYLVNNVLHNLPHNDRLKAKGDAAEGEKKDLIDKHYRMIVDGAACRKPFDKVGAELAKLGTDIGLRIRCQKSEIFEKMHRV